jgi:uncharacterized protein
MEEILASIRRIISEDDAPPSTEAEAAAPEPEVLPEPEPLPEPMVAEAEDDVLELTERVDATSETHGDLEVYSKPEASPEPAAVPRPAPVLAREPDEALVSETSAFAAASSFGQLTATIVMPEPGRTLEDLTRELLTPLLKAWLDQHLPGIVEAKVAAEVERIARTRVR